MRAKNHHNQYLETQVLTASPGKLVMMLYDGAVRFGNLARASLERGEIEASHNYIVRVQNIVCELRLSLNMSVGPIARNLWDLYSYLHTELVKANLNKDPGPLENAIGIIQNLRESWSQAIGQEMAQRPSLAVTHG